jgi:hypothetical protein
MYEDGKLEKWLAKKENGSANETNLSMVEKKLLNILNSL